MVDVPGMEPLRILPTPATPVSLDPRHAGRETAGRRLLGAFEAFETFPALRRSRDEMLQALADGQADPGRLVAIVESDPALAIAVLRAGARAARARKPQDVPGAIAVLSAGDLELVARDLRVYDFFEQSRLWSETAERFRVHARATQSATDHVCRALDMGPRPDLLVAALLHDIGKLVLLRAYDRYEPIWQEPAGPADRLALERAELGIDHALAGGVLARRLGLPDWLVRVIDRHHADDASQDAAVIRLADMLAHHAAGGPVHARELTAAARAAGMSPEQIRAALHELPGGARVERRAAGPSPLTARETEMVRKLSEGKLYKQIAAELDLKVSTVRTHLCNTYKKLGVADRAQAVLLATGKGWI